MVPHGQDTPTGPGVVALARALVAVNTQNPPGMEAAILPVLMRMLDPVDPASVVFAEPSAGRRSALIALPGHTGPTVVFNAHLDVAATPPSAWTRADGEIAGGRLYGRGSSDMKGGLACVVEALRRIYARCPKPGFRALLHLVADEERGSRDGMEWLAGAGMVGDPDVCLIPEPTGLTLAYAECGVAWMRISLRRTQPPLREQGGTATSAAARVALAFDGKAYEGGNPVLPPTACNVGAIRVEGPPNRLATAAEMQIDVRLRQGDRPADVVAWAESVIAASLGATADLLSTEVVIEKFAPATETDPETGLARLFTDSAARALGHPPATSAMQGPTDARYYRSRGIPAVVFGPGDPSVAHRPDEWVGLAALSQAADVYERFLTDLAEGH